MTIFPLLSLHHPQPPVVAGSINRNPSPSINTLLPPEQLSLLSITLKRKKEKKRSFNALKMHRICSVLLNKANDIRLQTSLWFISIITSDTEFWVKITEVIHRIFHESRLHLYLKDTVISVTPFLYNTPSRLFVTKNHSTELYNIFMLKNIMQST